MNSRRDGWGRIGTKGDEARKAVNRKVVGSSPSSGAISELESALKRHSRASTDGGTDGEIFWRRRCWLACSPIDDACVLTRTALCIFDLLRVKQWVRASALSTRPSVRLERDRFYLAAQQRQHDAVRRENPTSGLAPFAELPHGKVPPGPGDGTVRAAVGRRAAAARPPRWAPGRPPPLPAPPNGQQGRAAPRRCRLWAWAPRHSVRSIPPIVRRWRLDRLTPRGELRFSRQPSAATRPEPRGPAPARGARYHFVSHGLPGRPAASASVGTGQAASCRSDPRRLRLPTGRGADGRGGEQPSGVAALLSGYGAPPDRVVLRLHETPPTRLNRRR